VIYYFLLQTIFLLFIIYYRFIWKSKFFKS